MGERTGEIASDFDVGEAVKLLTDALISDKDVVRLLRATASPEGARQASPEMMAIEPMRVLTALANVKVAVHALGGLDSLLMGWLEALGGRLEYARFGERPAADA